MQQSELDRSETQFSPVESRRSRRGRQPHAIDLYHLVPGRCLGQCRAAKYRPESRRQFTRVEGLWQIVVGPDLEAHDPLHVVAAGGEHDHGQFRFLPQIAEHVKAIHLWQHHVEDHHVKAVRERTGKAGLTVIHRLDVKSLIGEILRDKLAEFLVVIDDEYPIHIGDFTSNTPSGHRFYVSLRKHTLPIHFARLESCLLYLGREFYGLGRGISASLDKGEGLATAPARLFPLANTIAIGTQAVLPAFFCRIIFLLAGLYRAA